jgi:hypothetical protein
MDLEIIGIGAFLAGGVALAAMEVFLKPKFLMALAMWSAFLFAASMCVYFFASRGEPIFEFVLVSALGSTGLALVGVGSNWLTRKIRQNSIDELDQFDRKKRRTGEYY